MFFDPCTCHLDEYLLADLQEAEMDALEYDETLDFDGGDL